MTDLSNYIYKELNTIKSKIQQTPPKKVVSLKKIQRLVDEAPIRESEKKQLCRSIHTVEVAMRKSSKLIVKNEYAKNLFYDHLLLEERNLNKKGKKVEDSPTKEEKGEYNKLLRKLEEVRKARLKR